MKKLKIILIFLIGIFLFASASYSANVVTQAQGIVNLVLDADWNWLTTFPDRKSGLEVQYIIFHPGAVNDVLVLRESSDTGPYYFPPALALTAEDSKIIYCGGLSMKLHIDMNASTLSAGHVIIIFYK